MRGLEHLEPQVTDGPLQKRGAEWGVHREEATSSPGTEASGQLPDEGGFSGCQDPSGPPTFLESSSCTSEVAGSSSNTQVWGRVQR